MKCTIFGDLVGELVQLAARNDVQPLIVVAQLFKPSVYLNETKQSLCVSSVLESGFFRSGCIQKQETSCWILASIVSVESGLNHWCYLSCNSCIKKVNGVSSGYECINYKKMVLEPIQRFRLHLIVADGIGCLSLMV
ncbi:hypothetical protein PIB30_017878 [Stylosanthes scabra]|uniref:Uncharacterized protein n=1 Tax=Stylosanthes scabra TaxID=79078 RepID=A0ABU6Y879_9FABA|nr:hypothetical protein [Stylosanthes scabra]